MIHLSLYVSIKYVYNDAAEGVVWESVRFDVSFENFEPTSSQVWQTQIFKKPLTYLKSLNIKLVGLWLRLVEPWTRLVDPGTNKQIPNTTHPQNLIHELSSLCNTLPC